jgi:hypothetical protein
MVNGRRGAQAVGAVFRAWGVSTRGGPIYRVPGLPGRLGGAVLGVTCGGTLDPEMGVIHRKMRHSRNLLINNLHVELIQSVKL